MQKIRPVCGPATRSAPRTDPSDGDRTACGEQSYVDPVNVSWTHARTFLLVRSLRVLRSCTASPVPRIKSLPKKSWRSGMERRSTPTKFQAQFRSAEGGINKGEVWKQWRYEKLRCVGRRCGACSARWTASSRAWTTSAGTASSSSAPSRTPKFQMEARSIRACVAGMQLFAFSSS